MDDSPASAGSLATNNLRRQLFSLAIPVLCEQVLTFCVGFFDVFLSGRLGKTETAAIGLSAYVSWLASMMFSLVGIGTSAIVAREWGAGEHEKARRILGRSLAMTPLIGLIIFLILQLMATGFPQLLKMEGEQLRIAVEYLRYDACGQFFAGWTLIAAAGLRGAGDMVTPLKVLVLTNVVNIIVSSTCTFGFVVGETAQVLVPALGVKGIVIGTVISHICGAAAITCILFSRPATLRLIRSDLEFHRETIWRILRIGGPAALGGLCTFIGHFAFLMVIARLSPLGFDGATFAAHVVGIRIESMSYLPVEAFGIAAATLVGQSLGAGQLERAKQAGHEAVRQCIGYAALMSVIFFVFAQQIFAMMHADVAVSVAGVPAFRMMALYQVPNALLIVYMNALRGAGDTKFPLYCALLGNVFVRVSIGYLCGVYWQMGLLGAWIGMGADNLLRCVLITWRYVAGRWTRTRV
ncbi:MULTISPECIES: MATE family efflux transporter [unclassified Schlesneria]|uniref:MATE family efflux transporter n=1 Tax=unclassified Schlesneria TaxID=2762017 RepID=UPI002EE5960D